MDLVKRCIDKMDEEYPVHSGYSLVTIRKAGSARRFFAAVPFGISWFVYVCKLNSFSAFDFGKIFLLAKNATYKVHKNDSKSKRWTEVMLMNLFQSQIATTKLITGIKKVMDNKPHLPTFEKKHILPLLEHNTNVITPANKYYNASFLHEGKTTRYMHQIIQKQKNKNNFHTPLQLFIPHRIILSDTQNSTKINPYEKTLHYALFKQNMEFVF